MPPDWKSRLSPTFSFPLPSSFYLLASHVGHSDLGLYVVQADIDLLTLPASDFLMLGLQVYSTTQVYANS